MSRYLRQDPIDGWHHITNHAVSGEDLFLTDKDRYEFIRRMTEASAKYRVKVAAYCLMGNHFHLVLYCPQGGLSKFMHYLESIYAREFNMRHGRRGALFGSEFHNVTITNEGQALAAIRYVHRNPLELGVNVTTYPWSSYLAYLDDADDLGAIDVTWARELVGEPYEHRRYVETDHDSDKTRLAMGVRSVYRSAPESFERSLMTLCEIASTLYGIDIQEIVAPRARARSDLRLAVSLIAYESRTGFAEEVRTALGYRSASTLRSATMRARQRVGVDIEFARLVAELRRRWAASDEALAG